MTSKPAPGTASDRYGPIGFAATLVNILVLGVITWIFVGALIVFVAPPVLLIDAGIAFGLSRVRGTAGRIGWGMLIGCLAVLLTLVAATVVFLVAHASGL